MTQPYIAYKVCLIIAALVSLSLQWRWFKASFDRLTAGLVIAAPAFSVLLNFGLLLLNWLGSGVWRLG